jgi:hypothetical protein
MYPQVPIVLPPQISKNSIVVADKEIPAVIDNSHLSITKVTKEKINVNNDGEKTNPKKVNDNQMTVEKMLKYATIIEFYGLPINIDDFINDKNYQVRFLIRWQHRCCCYCCC